MSTGKFFEEHQDQSIAKARIVSKYFTAWAQVIVSNVKKRGGKMAYVDLYAGPGRYKDGSASTPLMVLEAAINNPKTAESLVTFFNDRDENNTSSLQKEVNALPRINNLKFKPVIFCNEVDQDAEKYFNEIHMLPSFTFIDPWGYKGLSLKIIKGVIKDWGCDCVFFFNYRRINAGISNSVFKQHMDALFGENRAQKLRKKIKNLSPSKRENAILKNMISAIKEMGGQYVLPFRFLGPTGRPTHYLIFVSKSFRGYEIMKDIMAKESSKNEEDVPSFVYSPMEKSSPSFSFEHPLSKLRASLLSEFAGKELTVKDIYEKHSVDKPFILKNYKKVLLGMEDKGLISVRSLKKSARRRGTIADHLLVKFSESGGDGR